MATWEWEMKALQRGVKCIAGIDEVGRGAWAGPIVAVAYVFHTLPTDISVTDSKLLSERQRLALAQQLKELGSFGLGEVLPPEIDRFGIQEAQYEAYRRAIVQLPIEPDLILLDGRPWRECHLDHEAIVGGDRLVASIAAASILAKVYRDTLMKTTHHPAFPGYGFLDHVGYGTKLHQQALQQFGPSPIHRFSYKPIRTYLINKMEQKKDSF